MSITLSNDYIEEQVIKNAGYVKKLHNGNLNGCCPICREGKSWGKKRRLFYIPSKNIIHCHNCGLSWSPLKWIQLVTNESYKDIINDSKKYESFIPDYENDTVKQRRKHILPHEAINLFNREQITFYKNNSIIKKAVKYVLDRRLHLAINRVDLYISLSDFVHRNRLIIPFINRARQIDFYQTRSLFTDDYPKYLSKMDADKTIFGINNINPSIPYIFIFEGPIDAMFVKNGVSMGGLNISNYQIELLSQYFLFEKIWVLDNQINNKEVLKKYEQLIGQNERIVIWPDTIVEKDVNEYCCNNGLNEMSVDFFIQNSFCGGEAKKRLNII